MFSIVVLFGILNNLMQNGNFLYKINFKFQHKLIYFLFTYQVHGISSTVNVNFSYKSDGVLPCSGVINATFYANNAVITPDSSKYVLDSTANSLTVKNISNYNNYNKF